MAGETGTSCNTGKGLQTKPLLQLNQQGDSTRTNRFEHVMCIIT